MGFFFHFRGCVFFGLTLFGLKWANTHVFKNFRFNADLAMPFLNSVISWQCPILSTAVLVCVNYLLVESVNKANWLVQVSLCILAVVIVDYYHRLTLLQTKYTKLLLRLPFLVHGSRCQGESQCHDFIGDLPFFIYTFLRSIGIIFSYFIPDAILIYVIVIILSVFGLTVEHYISFMNMLVIFANVLIIIGGLHRLDLLKYFLLPLSYFHRLCYSYLEAVAASANDLEDKFVQELNGDCTKNSSNGRLCLLNDAMAEMYLPEILQPQSASKQARQIGLFRKATSANNLEPENDSDCDSILINRSRMPSPSQSYSSAEDVAQIEESLFFSEEDEVANAFNASLIMGSGDTRSMETSKKLPNENKSFSRDRSVHRGHSELESFEFVSHDSSVEDDTQPTSQQVDSQGPYVYCNTRSRSKIA